MKRLQPFSIARLPHILFGEGKIAEIPTQIMRYGKHVLIVTGAHAFLATPHWETLQQNLSAQGIHWEHVRIHDEPSPEQVDQITQTYRSHPIDVVLGIGGGSVLDAAKAVAGLLLQADSVMAYLEGVGHNKVYQGPAIPFIAVPTTAGTGSEATKNAVLGQRGEAGFKKSFRHELLIPQVAIIDPDLLASCPPALIAANGMDAFTQLLESYVSCHANPLTDALALSGMTAFRDGFFAVWESKSEEVAQAGRSQLAYAALLSGITLAQTGLGVVHGLASPLGAFFPCPHGVVCGTLVAEATAINITALQARAPKDAALIKYADVGTLLNYGEAKTEEEALEKLIAILRQWTERLELPRLSHYGMQAHHLSKVIAHCRGSSMKTNPIVLLDEEIEVLLRRRL